jgi:DNA-directed RNA polymerase specialized sigma24 family protein
LSEGTSSPPNPPSSPRHAELLALADELRPELHRYCARLMGSVIEGEDVVQDTFIRAFVAVDVQHRDGRPLAKGGCPHSGNHSPQIDL